MKLVYNNFINRREANEFSVSVSIVVFIYIFFSDLFKKQIDAFNDNDYDKYLDSQQIFVTTS